MTGQHWMYFEPWEINNWTNLHVYLTANALSHRPAVSVTEAVNKKVIGQETQYRFEDGSWVVVNQYNDGRGRVMVVGEGDLDAKMDEIKGVLEFKKIGKRR